jgi:hypothetical protein
LLQLPLAVVAVFVFGFAGLGGDTALWSLAVSSAQLDCCLTVHSNHSSNCNNTCLVSGHKQQLLQQQQSPP